MSIRQQVEDALFLKQNARHVGALTVLMLAVAASSRKCFPKGTPSVERPGEAMSDSEAFRLFLGGRIRKLLFGDYGSPEFGSSGLSVDFKGKQYEIEHVLYKLYRCELVHDGELPEDVEFVPPDASEAVSANRGLAVQISTGNKMALDHGWIDLLVNAVVRARCNGAEFGIKHLELVPKPSIDETVFCNSTIAKHGITPGRFSILKHATLLISPEGISASTDEALVDQFGKLVGSGEIGSGAVTGLSSRDLTDRTGRLQAKGLSILREIAAAYIRVEA